MGESSKPHSNRIRNTLLKTEDFFKETTSFFKDFLKWKHPFVAALAHSPLTCSCFSCMMEYSQFVIGFLSGVIVTSVIFSMGMKRSIGSAEPVEAPPLRTRLRTAEDARAVRRSRVWSLIWTWTYDDNDGTDGRGSYKLRPLIPPEDIDLGRGQIILYKWSKTRSAWIWRK